MFKAIGTIMLLYVLSSLFAGAFQSFEKATMATFGTIEAAANHSTRYIESMQ